jgi:hypothetical protein
VKREATRIDGSGADFTDDGALLDVPQLLPGVARGACDEYHAI